MASSVYNCNSTEHLSKFCTKPQKYSRCPNCKNVCFSEFSHKNNCRSTNFISEEYSPVAPDDILARNAVFEGQYEMAIEIAIKSIENIHVFNDGMEADASDSILHVEADIYIERVRKNAFAKAKLGWNGDLSKVIVVAEKRPSGELEKLVKILVGKNSIKVNKNFQLLQDGSVNYDANGLQSTDGHFDCLLVIKSNIETIDIRLKWENFRSYFDVRNEKCTLNQISRIIP